MFTHFLLSFCLFRAIRKMVRAGMAAFSTTVSMAQLGCVPATASKTLFDGFRVHFATRWALSGCNFDLLFPFYQIPILPSSLFGQGVDNVRWKLGRCRDTKETKDCHYDNWQILDTYMSSKWTKITPVISSGQHGRSVEFDQGFVHLPFRVLGRTAYKLIPIEVRNWLRDDRDEAVAQVLETISSQGAKPKGRLAERNQITQYLCHCT